MLQKVRLIVGTNDFSPQGFGFLNPKNAVKTLLDQNKDAHVVKDLPVLNGHVVEVDSGKASTFKKQMQSFGILVGEDATYSIPTPIELRFPAWPHDPRTNHLMNPQDRIDATHEVLKQLDPNWFNRGIAGKGVTVCVIDTGVYPDVEIRDRIVGMMDMIHGQTGGMGGTPTLLYSKPDGIGAVDDCYDDDGHGTHVAGLIAADGSTTGGKFKGVAPEASIFAVKVLNAQGGGSLSDIISGMQFALENKDKYGIRIVSMSLGGPANLKPQDDLIALAVRKLYEGGIVPVIAAGNSGPGEATIGSPGISPYAVTVAAWDDRNTPSLADDGITWWSSRGGTRMAPNLDQSDKPNIAGLGNQMVSLRSPGSYLDLQNLPHYDAHHLLMSGTSMATPWTAGGIADIVSVNPLLTVPQVFGIVKGNGYGLPAERSIVQGNGLLNVPKACDQAEALKSGQPAA